MAVGGTFDTIHLGHERLLTAAFEAGELILLGLTSDRLVERLRKTHAVKPYGDREAALKEFLRGRGWLGKVRILPIEGEYGLSHELPDLEGLAVSEETYPDALEVNRIRRGKGLKELEIIRVSMVMAEDGKPISSTRIRAGEIASSGVLTRRL